MEYLWRYSRLDSDTSLKEYALRAQSFNEARGLTQHEQLSL